MPMVIRNSRLSAADKAVESMSICVIDGDPSAFAITAPRLLKVIVVVGMANPGGGAGEMFIETYCDISPAALVSIVWFVLMSLTVQKTPLPRMNAALTLRLTASDRARCMPF